MAREPTKEERERIARGKRYDPSKPEPPWHERGDDGDDRTVTVTPPVEEKPPEPEPEPPKEEPPYTYAPEPEKVVEVRGRVPWKGVEPKTPEAIAKAKAYKPPPSVLEPVIEQPPRPKKRVMPLEPVIPQRVADFVKPKGAKATEWDVKGNVTVYTTPDGVRHYTPYSTMWVKGYKTDTEYHAPGSEARFDIPSQATTPPPWVAVTGSKGVLAHISRADAEKVSKLRGEQQFYKLISLGVIDPGSKFMPGKEGYKGTDWSYITPWEAQRQQAGLLLREFIRKGKLKETYDITPLEEQVAVLPRVRQVELAQAVYITELKKQKEQMPPNFATLLDAIEKAEGFDAKSQAIDEYNKALAVYMGGLVRLPDGEYIGKETLAEYKRDYPELYQLLITKGFKAAEERVAEIQQEYEDYLVALKAMDEHRIFIRPDPEAPALKQRTFVFNIPGAIVAGVAVKKLNILFGEDVVKANRVLIDYTTAEGADIPKFLRDHPDREAVVLAAGYSQDAVDNALGYNKEYLGIGAPNYIDRSTFIKDYFKERGWKYDIHRGVASQADIITHDTRLVAAIKAHGAMFDAPMTFADFRARYFQDKGWELTPPEVPDVFPLTGKQLAKLKQFNAKVQKANDAYVNKYGLKAVGESVGGQTLGFVFAPARAIYPNVKLEDITGWEWAIGAAQVALVAAPFVAVPFGVAARVASLSIQATAVGIFTAHTVKHWGEMSPVHKGLALGLDILITVAILRGAGLRLPKVLTPRNIINNLKSHFNAAGMDAVATKRVDLALRDLVRGIELNDERLIRQAVSILQKEAARAPKMPPSIVKSIKDGGSYIKKNASSYRRVIQTTRETSIADDVKLLSVGTRVPSGQVPRNALARMYNLWRGESRTALLSRLDKSIEAGRRHLLTLESRARGVLRQKLYQEKLATEKAKIARMTEREKDALIARETGKPEGYYSLQRLMDEFKREWAKRVALKRKLYDRIGKEKMEAEKAKVARMSEAEKDALIEKMTGKEAGYFKRQKLMAQFKREWVKRVVEKQKLYERIGKEKLVAEKAKIAGMTEAEKDIYLAKKMGKPSGYFKRQILMGEFKREWARRDALYRKMLDKIAQDKLKLEKAKIARMTEAEKDALLEKMTGKEAGYYNRQRLMGEFKRMWAKRVAGKQELYNKIVRLKLEAEKKKWSRMTMEEIDEFLEKFAKVKGKLSRKVIDKETSATLKEIEEFLKKHKALPPEQRATLGKVDDAIKEAEEIIKESKLPRVTEKAPEVKVKLKPEVKPEVKIAVKERVVARPKPTVTVRRVKIAEDIGVKAKPMRGIPIAIPRAIIAPAVAPLPSVVPILLIRPEDAPQPLGLPFIAPTPATVKVPAPTPIPTVATVTAPEAAPAVAPIPAPKLAPKPAPKPEAEPVPVAVIVPRPAPAPAPVPVPTPVPKPKPKSKPKPVPVPKPEKPPPPVPLPFRGRRRVRPRRVPGGSIAWALGMRKGVRGLLVPNWFYIPPPFDQPKPISLSAPPIGALRADSASPYETIQVIGRSRRGVPRRVNVDLGWADIEVINGKEIHFRGGGLETDIGTRMPSPTKGMAVDERGGFTGEPIFAEGVSQRKMPRKKTTRKKQRLSHYEYMTTVKGFRP